MQTIDRTDILIPIFTIQISPFAPQISRSRSTYSRLQRIALLATTVRSEHFVKDNELTSSREWKRKVIYWKISACWNILPLSLSFYSLFLSTTKRSKRFHPSIAKRETAATDNRSSKPSCDNSRILPRDKPLSPCFVIYNHKRNDVSPLSLKLSYDLFYRGTTVPTYALFVFHAARRDKW